MSITGAHIEIARSGVSKSWLARLIAGAVAVGVIGIGFAVLSYLVFATGLVPAPRNPFSTGSATFAPMKSGIGGFVLMVQSQFYAALTTAMQAMKADGVGLTSLATIGFLYGIFHAAGPGHGKGVIAGYITASRSSIATGLTLSLAAALLQAGVAIAVVGVFAVALKATAATIDAAVRNIELASFAAVAGMGAVLVWTKSGEFVRSASVLYHPTRNVREFQNALPHHRAKDWRILAGVVLAAGIRPCSGAIILLVFALAQDLFVAGVVGAIAMAVGTWVTTGTLASLTVFAKSVIHRVTATRALAGAVAFAAFELLAAAFVLVLGSLLFVGVWAGGMLSALD